MEICAKNTLLSQNYLPNLPNAKLVALKSGSDPPPHHRQIQIKKTNEYCLPEISWNIAGYFAERPRPLQLDRKEN